MIEVNQSINHLIFAGEIETRLKLALFRANGVYVGNYKLSGVSYESVYHK